MSTCNGAWIGKLKKQFLAMQLQEKKSEYSETVQDIAYEWGQGQKFDVIELAKLCGVGASDEAIYKFVGFIQMADRSQHHLMNHQRFAIVQEEIRLRTARAEDFSEGAKNLVRGLNTYVHHALETRLRGLERKLDAAIANNSLGETRGKQ